MKRITCERPSPVVNAQRIWTAYRTSDAAFLLAAIALHHASGGGDLPEAYNEVFHQSYPTAGNAIGTELDARTTLR